MGNDEGEDDAFLKGHETEDNGEDERKEMKMEEGMMCVRNI